MSALASISRRVPRHAITISGDDDVRVFMRLLFAAKLGGVAAETIQVRPLTGGLTNVLHHAWHEPTQTHAVVRQYGEGTEAIVDRDAEEFWLGGFLRTFGRCANGLAYEFLVDHAPMSLDAFRARHLDLATAFAEFHARAASYGRCALPHATAENYVTAIHLGLFVRRAFEHDVAGFLSHARAEAEKAASCAAPVDESAAQRVAQIDVLMNGVQAAAARLLAVIESVRPVLVEGPCHNDLNALNVLVHKDSTQGSTAGMRFIDLEYMRRSFVLYDLGNHMEEYAGFDGEWDLMLTREQKIAFLRRYLAESAKLCFGGAGSSGRCADDDVAVEGSLEPELALLELFELVSSVGWAAWAMAQAATSAIDFDYIAYAAMRFRHYLDRADGVIAAVHENVPMAKTG